LQFENRDLQFQAKDGVQKSLVEVLGHVTTLTHRPVTTFEKPLEINAPPDMLANFVKERSIYQESVALAPGLYHLNIMAKDVVAGNVAPFEMALNVPHFSEDRLASSSLILADKIETLPTRNIGGGQFAIGDTKVRPRLGDKFSTDEKMGVYIQFYNFAPDEKTNKPEGTIQYLISKVGSTDNLIDVSEDIATISYASANQVTVKKLLPLKSLGVGTYTLKVKATDKRGNQTVQQQSNFIVN
jgi:hypothetical protein